MKSLTYSQRLVLLVGCFLILGSYSSAQFWDVVEVGNNYIEQDTLTPDINPNAITITTANWSNRVDIDGDGFSRSRTLRIYINSTENKLVTFRIWKRADGGSNSVYWDSPGGSLISQGNYIYELPGIGTTTTGGELSHDYYDFSIFLLAWPTGELLANLIYSQEGNLDDQTFETAAEDQVVLLPDLIVQNISVSPVNVQPGGTINVSCSVTNIGSGTAGSSRVGYYLVSTCNGTMVYLGDDPVGSLSTNQSSPENETLTVPSNTIPGVYYIAFVADYQNSIPESNENNNKACGEAFFEVVLPTPIITVSPTSMNFGNVNVNSCSSPQSYSLTGTNLTSSVIVTAQNGFELSLNGSAPWASNLNIPNQGGSLTTTIYARFCPSSVQSYNGNVTHTSSGASPKNVSVSGVGVEIPPTAPTNLSATVISSTQINLTWTDNSNNETGFKIERKQGTAGSWSEIAQVSQNSQSYSDNGLTPNTLYYYRVRAYNSIGNSGYSNEANATTHDVAPNMPLSLQALPQSSTQINLTWTDNSNNETGFKIERKLGAVGSWSEIAQLPQNSQSYSDNGLTPNTLYYYRVRAYNSIGNSGYTNEANAMTYDVAPNMPLSLQALPQSSTQINLTWTDNSTNETGFKIERKQGVAGSWSEIAQVSQNSQSYSDNGLTPNTQYYYRVRAYNLIGNSGYSNESNATTHDIVPNSPSNLQALPQSSTQINLTWTDNSTNETGFRLERKSPIGIWSEIIQLPQNSQSYSDIGLIPATQYHYRLIAYNSIGNSGYSNEANAKTHDVVPNPPTNLSAVPFGNSGINLNWTDNSVNETGFRVEQKTETQGNWIQLVSLDSNVTNYSINNGLQINTLYCFRVKSYNSIGESVASNEECLTISSIHDLEKIAGLPTFNTIYQNFPNPFNPTSLIKFGIVEESKVSLRIYDMLGNEVSTVLSNETLNGGFYQYSFNAEKLPSGIYLYSLSVSPATGGPSFRETKKMILMK